MDSEKKIKLEKQNYLESLINKFRDNTGLIFTDYKGLKVNEISELRRELKSYDCKYMVIKNTIASIALQKTGLPNLVDYVSGPTAVLICKCDILPVTKKLVRFAKEHQNLKIKFGYLFNKIVTPDEINEISKLPSKEILLSQFMTLLQSPLYRLLNVLQGPLRNLVFLMNEIVKKKS